MFSCVRICLYLKGDKRWTKLDILRVLFWNIQVHDCIPIANICGKLTVEVSLPSLKRALKAIFNSKSELYEELLRRAGLTSLRLQDIAIIMFKVKNGLTPLYITELFNVPNSHYNLPNADFSQVRFNSVQYGKHLVRYFGPHLWSRLSSSDKAKNSRF